MPVPDVNLQLVLCLCYFTNVGLSVLVVSAGKPFPGARLWVAGQGLLALGTLFDALPASVPAWLPLAVGNTFYAVSSLLFLHSVWAFRYRSPFPRWIYGLALVQGLSFFLTLDQPYWVRSSLFSFWMVVGPVATGTLLIWRVDAHFRFSHWLTAFPFYILGLSSLIRVGILSSSGLGHNEAPLGAVNVWYVSGAILLGNIILFGYFMMIRTRNEQRLSQKDELIETRNRKLVESNRAKDLFFSIIAHDLRGPIGGAARYVRKHLLGKMSGLEAKYAEVETLSAALEKTNEFLEKLLWWSRAQLQDWTLQLVPLHLEKVIGEAVAHVQPAADMKEIELEVAPGPYPQPLGDPESVQIILGNLLSNAVKFTLTGRHIRLKVSVIEQLCRIVVEDEGVGMDKATLDRLFRIEDKLTTHGTSGERGSGLGLLLCQSLAQRNNGGVVMESEPWVGTQATLWLPILPAQK